MDQDKLQELLLAGAIEIFGVDSDSGEFLYSFTSRLASVDPELAKTIQEVFFKDVMFLWEGGFVDVDFMHDSPLVSLTDMSFNNELISALHPRIQNTLANIKRSLREE